MLREPNLPHLHSRLKGLFQLDTQQDQHQPEDLCRLNILLTLLLMKSLGMSMQFVHPSVERFRRDRGEFKLRRVILLSKDVELETSSHMIDFSVCFLMIT